MGLLLSNETLVCLNISSIFRNNRGYCKAMLRYKLLFSNVENIPLIHFWKQEKEYFISPSNHVIKCSFYYIITKWNTKPFLNHFWYIFVLAAKGMTYHVNIAKVIFLCVKITSYFHVQGQHIFARKLTWYFQW